MGAGFRTSFLIMLMIVLANSILPRIYSDPFGTLPNDDDRIVTRVFDLSLKDPFSREFTSRLYMHCKLRELMIILLPVPFVQMMGIGQSILVSIASVFGSMALLSIYMLGKRLKNDRVGIIAALLTFVNPMFQNSNMTYSEEMMALPFAILCLYAILRSDFFRKRKYSVAFFTLFAIGSLFKFTLWIYLAGPLLVYAIHNRKVVDKELLIGMGKAMLIPIVIFTLTNPITMEVFKHYFSMGITSESFQYMDIGTSYTDDIDFMFSFENLSYYPMVLGYWELSTISVAALLFSLPFFLKDMDHRKKIVLAGVLFPLILFTFVVLKNKNPIYLLPSIAFLSLLSAIGIDSSMKNPGFLVILLFLALMLSTSDHFQKPISMEHYKMPRSTTEKLYQISSSWQSDIGEKQVTVLRCSDIDELFIVLNDMYEKGVDIDFYMDPESWLSIEDVDYVLYNENYDSINLCDNDLLATDRTDVVLEEEFVNDRLYVLSIE